MLKNEWEAIGECYTAWAASLGSGTRKLIIDETEAGIQFFTLLWWSNIAKFEFSKQITMTVEALMLQSTSPVVVGKETAATMRYQIDAMFAKLVEDDANAQ